MSRTLFGIVIVVRPVQPVNAFSPILVTLLLFAKITEVTVVSLYIHSKGMSPVIVDPTCTPEELNAFEVVMGALGSNGGTNKLLNCGKKGILTLFQNIVSSSNSRNN
jgi:hypothetical protein